MFKNKINFLLTLSQPVRARAMFAALAFLICLSGNARAGFLYSINDNSAGNQIYGYNVNESTGALTALAGFPVATGGNGTGVFDAQQITIDRANRRLYVNNRGSDTVSAYSINPTSGALTALPFSPFATGTTSERTLAVHPSGSPLIIGGDALASFNVTATSATAAAGSPFSTGAAAPRSSVFSRDGNYVYAGGNITNNNLFAGFSVNPTNGVLTALPGSPFDSGAPSPTGYATDSQGRIFMASLTTNQVRAFTTASGVPTGVTGNPFASGLTSVDNGVLSPNENFYYAADRSGNRIGAYQIAGSGASTTLTALAGSPVASGGTYTDALVFNGSGNFLFAANGDSRNITTYNVDQTTGVPTFNNVQAADTLGAAGRLTGIDYLPTAAPTATPTPTATPMPTPVSCTPPPSGIAAWLPGDGNANDISGNGNNGTLNGVTFTAGKVAQAFQDNGNGSVNVPDSPSLNFTTALTVEAWINPSALNTNVTFTPIIDKGFGSSGNPSTYVLTLLTGTGQVQFVVGSTSVNTFATSPNAIPLNTFTHVAGTYDGATVRIYVNGVLADSQATTISSLAPSNTPLVIGRSVSFINSFVGIIDETTLYNRALSQTEIQAIVNADSAGKCKMSPTAAAVSVGGRVTTASGRSITGVRISLTDSQGNVRTTVSTAFGYYRFDDVQAGETYILNISAKHYQFENSTRVLNVSDEMDNVNFAASPEREKLRLK